MSSHSGLWVIWELGGLGLLRLQPCRGSGERWRRYQGLWVTGCSTTVQPAVVEGLHMCGMCQGAVCETQTVLLNYMDLFLCAPARCRPACTHVTSVRSAKNPQESVLSFYHGSTRRSKI